MTTKIPTFHTFGALLRDNKLIFSLFTSSAKSVKIHIYDPHSNLPRETHSLSISAPSIWTVQIDPIPIESEYLFEVDGNLVLDPYAKALSTPHTWGLWKEPSKCQLTFDHTFDWEDTKNPHQSAAQRHLFRPD